MKGTIYKFTNLVNGMSYVGATTRPENRYRQHRCHKGRGEDSTLHKAFDEYGFDNFKYEVLMTIDLEDKSVLKQKLAYFERFYIRKYKTFSEMGYNQTAGGPGMLGTHQDDDFKQRQSDRMKRDNPAWHYTDEWREHVREASRGRKMPDSQCKASSERMKANNPMKNSDVARRMVETRTANGFKLSEEAKRKISLANKGKVFSASTRQKMSATANRRPRDSKGHFIKQA